LICLAAFERRTDGLTHGTIVRVMGAPRSLNPRAGVYAAHYKSQRMTNGAPPTGYARTCAARRASHFTLYSSRYALIAASSNFE